MIWHTVSREFAHQRTQMFHWAPVFMAFGIWGTFHFGMTLGVWIWVIFGLCLLSYLLIIGWGDSAALPILVFLAMLSLGAAAAVLRGYSVWAPALSYPYYGEIVGRVIAIDRSANHAPRLTLDRVTLGRIPNHKTPEKIRLSFHSKEQQTVPNLGDIIKTRGFLSAPQGPVEPGGFDFQRYAYFMGLGAVGYARDPYTVVENGNTVFTVGVLQSKLSQTIDEHVNATVSGLAQAIIAGNRFDMPKEQIENLRVTNLAHLLAISGLHMGLVTSLIFFSIRLVCVVVPLRVITDHAKSIAAVAAISIGALYLMISGANVATQRAFIMVATFYLAVILGKRVISFRAVALAAIVILMITPESLLSPGFQMSFAATTALVFVFRLLADHTSFGRVGQVILGIFASSFVAGMATAPFSALHFNTFSQTSFFANILAVPVMSFVVAPAAILGLLCVGVGLPGWAFVGVEKGLEWIVGVAAYFADWPGSQIFVSSPPAWVGGAMALAGLIIVLWGQRFGTLIAAILAAAAVYGWTTQDRPDVLISRDARLVGALTPDGRAVSKPKGDQFTFDIWTENDGHPMDRQQATDLWATNVKDVRHIWSKKEANKKITCVQFEILVLAQDVEVQGPCLIINATQVQEKGAAAIWRDDHGKITKILWSDDYSSHYQWRPVSAPRSIRTN